MNNDSIQQIIEDIREWCKNERDEEFYSGVADRLEVQHRLYDKAIASLQAEIRIAERRISDASWAADQASNHRMGL